MTNKYFLTSTVAVLLTAGSSVAGGPSPQALAGSYTGCSPWSTRVEIRYDALENALKLTDSGAPPRNPELYTFKYINAGEQVEKGNDEWGNCIKHIYKTTFDGKSMRQSIKFRGYYQCEWLPTQFDSEQVYLTVDSPGSLFFGRVSRKGNDSHCTLTRE